MVNKPLPLLYDFRAHIEIPNPSASANPPLDSHTFALTKNHPSKAKKPATNVQANLTAQKTQEKDGEDDPITEEKVIDALNQDALKIADELRLEISKNLSQYENQYTVQVTISFSEGSIVAIGTVLLTAWTVLAPIVGDAAKKALDAELVPIIQFAIKKVLSSFLARCNVAVTDPILVNVIPSPNANSSTNQQSTFLQSLPWPLVLTVVGVFLFIILIFILGILLAPHIQIK